MKPTLEQLALAAGLSTRWADYRGEEHEVSGDTLRSLLNALELPANTPAQLADSFARVNAESGSSPNLLFADVGMPMALNLPGVRPTTARLVTEDGVVVDLAPQVDGHGQVLLPPIERPGYYDLLVGQQSLRLAVCPQRCFGVGDIANGERLWGLAAQLYALRRPGDGGIGDFAALATLAGDAAEQGADTIAISPIHALFSSDVSHYSPYSPSSRLFLNVLHATPAMVLGTKAVASAAESLQLEQTLKQLEQASLIDWPTAAATKLAMLRALHAQWAERLERGADSVATDYRRFVRDGGASLRQHACFEALQEHFFSSTASRWHWRSWPAEYQSPDKLAVAEFAARNEQKLRFHYFTQWLADRSLMRTQALALDAGMRIGLIADLAIGTDSGGSHCWSRQHDVLAGLTIGAPGDLLNAQGQNWGLTAFSPRALRQHAYQPFIETMRASLRRAGGLRIDHVLGLRRLWLIPEGAPASEGAYLQYPMQDMMRLIALESWRNRAIIIGEDLGTVPPGFREQLAQTGILGIQVLWFERDHGYFIDPSRWSPQALATTTTHDLPSVAGWWRQRDIDIQASMGHGDPAQRQGREHDRDALWAAFLYAGVAEGPPPAGNNPEPAVDAALAFVARTPSPLAIVPLEDVLGLDEQPNVPGTVNEHPNWRRRLPDPVDSLLQGAAPRRRLALLRDGRKA